MFLSTAVLAANLVTRSGKPIAFNRFLAGRRAECEVLDLVSPLLWHSTFVDSLDVDKHIGVR